MYAGIHLRFGDFSSQTVIELGPLLPRAIVFTLVMLFIMVAMGLYEREIKEGDWSYYSRFMATFPIGFIAMTFIFYAIPGLFLGRGVLGISFLVAMAGTATIRFIFLSVVDSEAIKRRVLVVGAGSRPAKVAALLNSEQGRNRFHLVGYMPIDGVHSSIPKSLIIEHEIPILAIATTYDVDEIVVGVRQRRGGALPMGELLECRMEGINVIDLSTFFERETGKVQLESLNPSWIIFSEGFDKGNFRNMIKRMFDLTASSILLLITLPVMLVTAILIKLDSKGPVFYKQERTGECGNPFQVYKFRSMRTDAETEGKPQWAKKDDDRVTRVGKIIRTLRIDELPQIINVLRGDMSFVGPRPERPFFVNQLIKEIPFFSTRHSVKPGITGWAQIRYPYGASVEDAKEKLQYDLYYAKNHTLFLDLIILFQTAQVVLFGKGAR
ncbi:MAG: TIGR03013 family PEP-CTERM/XrtA system glycosyltransferase [Gammaproteobacteria bacterium]|nr:TIGR03013 family PEP-CTERM/XrtA system glycosyltransferase [Gammaproteobacteria bacterium]